MFNLWKVQIIPSISRPTHSTTVRAAGALLKNSSRYHPSEEFEQTAFSGALRQNAILLNP